MANLETNSWNELSKEDRLALVNEQLRHWRRVKRLLLLEQQARTGEERAALRDELRAHVSAVADTPLSAE